MQQKTIYLEDDLLKKLNEESIKEKRSLNNFIVCVLLSFFESKERKY
jgi:hypothetical protein